MTYNGWINYETWCVNLWLSNGDDPNDLITDVLLADIDNMPDDDATYKLALALRDYVESMNPLIDEANIFSDLLGAALGEVDWTYLAEHWVEDYRADNPRKTTGDYVIEYGINARWFYCWEERDTGDWNGARTFWEVFNEVIQDAIDREYTSIDVEWVLDPADVTESLWIEFMLIRQNSRNQKRGV